MPAPDSRPLNTSVHPAVLERGRRVLRPIEVAALVMTGVALFAFAPTPPGTVQAQRVELVDSNGQAKAALSADSAGVILSLLDRQGRVRASLRLSDEPRVSVMDGAGREAAGLGVPRVQHLAH